MNNVAVFIKNFSKKILGIEDMGSKVLNFIQENRDDLKNPNTDRNDARKIQKFALYNLDYRSEVIDYWKTPRELLRDGYDDCDGWAGLIFWLMLELYFKDFRMAIFTNEQTNKAHMVVIWFEKGTKYEPWLLDPTGAISKDLIQISDISKYWKLKVSFDLEKEYAHDN